MLARKQRHSRQESGVRRHGSGPRAGQAPRLNGGWRGFTLVELLIVVVVIGLLLALLVPAISQARRRTVEARVLVEIKQLESAVGAFKNRFGIEPPSHYKVFLTPTGWNGG